MTTAQISTPPRQWWEEFYTEDPRSLPEEKAWLETLKNRTPLEKAWAQETAHHLDSFERLEKEISRLQDRLNETKKERDIAWENRRRFQALLEAGPSWETTENAYSAVVGARKRIRKPTTPGEGK